MYKRIDPFRTRTRVVCLDNFSIATVAGSATIRFSTGFDYYNLSNLSTLTDFTDQAASYFYVKIHGITVDILRSSDEATVSANMHGTSIYLNYYPTSSSTSFGPSSMSRTESTYKLDLMTFNKQKVFLPIYNLMYKGAVGTDAVFLNNAVMMDTSDVQYLKGELAMSSDNGTVNAAAILLFNLRVSIP
jgi:hypothetical protein